MATYLGSVISNWKPSKGMGKAVIPCFRPPLCTSLSEDDDACSFCSSLSEDLVKLKQSLGESSISLQWSAEAMALLKKMQVALLALFRKSKLPISFDTKEDWLDQYMKETAVVLDLCNSLKSVVSRISRYRIVVDLAIQKIQKDLSAASVNKEFERIEAECRQFLRVRKWRDWMRPIDGAASPPEQNNGEKNRTSVVMFMAKSATAALSLILMSAFISPVQVNVGDEQQVINELPQLKPFATSLMALLNHFHERISRGKDSFPGMVLAEQEMVEKLFGDLRSQVTQGMVKDEEFSRSVQLLRQRSLDLKEGIERFDSAVNEVFEVVIKGRNELLGAFRDETLT